ncbi:MAG: hypothetical protein NC548_47580 [Lachnospiraceae bacterium]|nr:hypothetical protein [Lachnospiraceae bacterium]
MKVRNLIEILKHIDAEKEVYYAKKQGKSTLFYPINNVIVEPKYGGNVSLE